ncbi:hypothetical protein Mal15_50390 [Stieleria maiorica]|uniref:Class I SAM-dependent methyltransferase n=2 Tax=Stieleria maiorica TaxID=2795974 RepID=A0A5B9MI25_9BACT|nr:hypothetical protein Mal15_50390 [Stieleria maiorica]
MDCLVCRNTSDSFAGATIMGKYEIEYFRCRDCQFIQTEEPYWLEEAYNHAIIPSDVGLIARNERLSRVVDRLLRYVYPQAFYCLDYGGGYGMFTRMMRDRGHHFLHRDPYCQNLFAPGLEGEPSAGGFDFLTALEVFEHFDNPHRELQVLDATADHWFVSTEPVPDPAPQPGQWWYYVLDGGQHISLWSKRALQTVAAHYGRQLISHRGVHVFSKTKTNPFWVKQILRDKASRVLDPFRRRRSLLRDDFQRAAAATLHRAA